MICDLCKKEMIECNQQMIEYNQQVFDSRNLRYFNITVHMCIVCEVAYSNDDKLINFEGMFVPIYKYRDRHWTTEQWNRMMNLKVFL